MIASRSATFTTSSPPEGATSAAHAPEQGPHAAITANRSFTLTVSLPVMSAGQPMVAVLIELTASTAMADEKRNCRNGSRGTFASLVHGAASWLRGWAYPI